MKKKIKILHLEASLGWGGQEIRILKEAKGMRKRGYEVYFAVGKKGKLKEKALKEGFEVFEVNYNKKAWFKTFFSLRKIIKNNDIDIINSHSSKDAWLGGIISKFLKRPIIRTRHLSTEIKKGLNSIILYNFLADYVVTTCQKTCEKISLQAKKKKEFCSSIPTGVEEIFVEEEKIIDFKKEFNLQKEDFLVGTMCFMRSWKGIEEFLYAANFLKEEKNIKWVIIGKGHDKKYKEIAKKLNLKNVFFTGHLENPFSAVASLDLFLLLSTAHEGVSQASLQASFLKKPIIGTPIGGIPEVCINNKTGISVPIFSYKKTAEAVMKLKKDSKLKAFMGENAKKLVLEKFTYEKMLDKMEEVYSKILKK